MSTGVENTSLRLRVPSSPELHSSCKLKVGLLTPGSEHFYS